MSDSARREAAKAAPEGSTAAPTPRLSGGPEARPLQPRLRSPHAADWKEIFCRRVKRPLPLVEHEQCPYCFGRRADIVTGEHERFCDWREGKDPVCFGFPETHGHFRTR